MRLFKHKYIASKFEIQLYLMPHENGDNNMIDEKLLGIISSNPDLLQNSDLATYVKEQTHPLTLCLQSADVQHPLPNVKIDTVPSWWFRADRILKENDSLMIVAGRQTTKTTFCSIYAATILLENPDAKILMVGHNAGNARCFLECMPKYHSGNVDVHSINELIDSHGNRLNGCQYDAIILDELAFIPWSKDEQFEHVHKLMCAALNPNGKMLYISTPAKRKGWFWEFYNKRNFYGLPVMHLTFDENMETKRLESDKDVAEFIKRTALQGLFNEMFGVFQDLI